MKQQTVAQLLKHDFKSKNSLHLYDSNGNLIYAEWSDGFWYKHEYDNNRNRTYYETSMGYWSKSEYDSKGNRTYYENSDGKIIDKRPKKETCNGKVVEIDGKKYQLKEVG